MCNTFNLTNRVPPSPFPYLLPLFPSPSLSFSWPTTFFSLPLVVTFLGLETTNSLNVSLGMSVNDGYTETCSLKRHTEKGVTVLTLLSTVEYLLLIYSFLHYKIYESFLKKKRKIRKNLVRKYKRTQYPNDMNNYESYIRLKFKENDLRFYRFVVMFSL